MPDLSSLSEMSNKHLEAARWRALANEAAAKVKQYLEGRLILDEEKRAKLLPDGVLGVSEAVKKMCKELAELWAKAFFSCDRVNRRYEFDASDGKQDNDTEWHRVEERLYYDDLYKGRGSKEGDGKVFGPSKCEKAEANLKTWLNHANGSIEDAVQAEERLYETDENGEMKQWRSFLEPSKEQAVFDRR